MIVSQIAATAVAKALLGQTWASDNVECQPIDPVSDAISRADESGNKPYIAVYVEQAEGQFVGNDRAGMPTSLTLKINVIITPGLLNLPEEAGVEMDGSVAAISLHVISRQVDNALRYGNSDWVKLWRQFARKTQSVKVRFILIELENGVRIPCLELLYDIEALPEPEIGTDLVGAFLTFDTLMRAEGENGIADVFKSLIVQPNDLPSYELFQAQHRLSDAALASHGTPPFDPNSVGEDGEPPLLTEVTVSDLPEEE